MILRLTLQGEGIMGDWPTQHDAVVALARSFGQERLHG